MSTTTTNYGLIKPDTTDPILIGQLNDNADIIDATLKSLSDVLDVAKLGIKYKGEVNYYSNLPASGNEIGDAYTVKYAGSSGTTPDGTEYVWGTVSGTNQWINFSKDSYTKAEVDALLALKVDTAGTGLSKSGTTLNHSNSTTAKTTQGFAQIAYDAQGHITGSTAATTAQANAINSGIDSTKVAQIETNKNNILSLEADIFNELKISDMTFVSNGYIKADGTVNTQSSSNAVFSMYLRGIKRIAITPSQALSENFAYGKITSANGTLKQVFVGNNLAGRRIYDINDVANDDILYITWYTYKQNPSPYYDSIEVSKFVENINPYSHCVDKTITYSGKKLQFFGDSITYGYLVGDTQSQYNYPSVFSNKVGASSFINSGINGSTLSIVSGYASIAQTIQSDLDTAADVVFVAGGVNDWQLGVDEAPIRTAISNICTYLKNHFTGNVIFITPINEAGRTPNAKPITSLNTIRRAITEIALSNEYNVVQGNLFPFPTKYDNATYITTMFQDKIHPTDVGYKMYAQALINALL